MIVQRTYTAEVKGVQQVIHAEANIDVDALLKYLAWIAFCNKSRKTVAVRGAVKVTVKLSA